jgi:Uma2 family endonuclease
MATATQTLLTAEEFLQLPDPPDGSRQELARGEIVTMPPPGYSHGVIQLNVGSLLHAYGRRTGRGRATTESGVTTERGPDSVRGPDVAFWAAEKIPLGDWPAGYPAVAPELVVEIVSESKRLSRVLDKLPEYFRCGVRMAWIVDFEDRTVRVYRSPDEGRILHTTATLTGEEILPGFECKVADIFA